MLKITKKRPKKIGMRFLAGDETKDGEKTYRPGNKIQG